MLDPIDDHLHSIAPLCHVGADLHFAQFKNLAIQRKTLQNRLRHLHDSERMQPIKEQIAALTERMAELRKEMKICTNVAEWSDAVEVIVNRIENPETTQEKTVDQGKDVPQT